jgi:hypothetical protein
MLSLIFVPLVLSKVADTYINPQPSTLNPQPSTLNPQPSTLNPQLTTTILRVC